MSKTKDELRENMDCVKDELDYAGMSKPSQFAVLSLLKNSLFRDAYHHALAGAFFERLLELDSGDIIFNDEGYWDIKSLKMANRINEILRDTFPEEWLQEYKDLGVYEKWAAEEES